MGFSLKEVVPWGRSFAEYVAMFRLSEQDLGLRILGCGDGPASFNAELTARGGRPVSLDPIYAWSKDAIHQRIIETYDEVMSETRAHAHEFVWRHVRSVDELGRVRMHAMQQFLDDYERGLAAGRYVDGALPQLSFAPQEFDLALCSHFLFLYSEHLSREFHTESIVELCRVAREVRIFPLLELGSTPSRHLESVEAALDGRGLRVELVTVPYEFQRGGNRMMRITKGALH